MRSSRNTRRTSNRGVGLLTSITSRFGFRRYQYHQQNNNNNNNNNDNELDTTYRISIRRNDSYQNESEGDRRPMIERIITTAKLIELIVIIMFFAYLAIVSKQTNNWDSTRKVGFGQSAICNDPSLTYDVAIVDINPSLFNNDGLIESYPYYNPYAYSRSSGQSQLCFDAAHLATWSATATFSFAELATHFERNKSLNYFPYSTPIIMLSIIGVLLTALFDDASPLSHTFDESHPSYVGTENNKYIMRRINLMSTVFLVGFLGGSGQSLIFVTPFDCQHYLLRSNEQYICDAVTAVGINLLTIISPNDSMIKGYKQFMFVAIVIIIVTNLFACVQFNLGNVTYVGRRGRVHVHNNREGEETLRIALQEFERQLNLRESMRQGQHQQQQPPFADRMAAISKRNQMIRSWKNSEKSANNKGDDCSICLAPLFDSSEESEAVDVITVPCNHQFHKPCIIEWSINHTTCPCCRQSLIIEDSGR